MTRITVHLAPSLMCQRPVAEIAATLPASAWRPDRWRQLCEALREHPAVQRRPRALESLAALRPEDQAHAAECALAMLAVCLQRLLDRPFDEWVAAAAASGAEPGFAAAGFAASGRVAYDYLDPLLASSAGRLALDLVLRMLGPEDAGADTLWRAVREGLDNLARWFEVYGLRETQSRVVLEARRRGVPVGRAPTSLPVVALGQGARQRWLWRANSFATPHMSVVLATGKHLANELLANAGLPVPAQRVVADLAGLRCAATELGYPLVVKPTNTDHGTAVTTSIGDEPTLVAAFERARAHGRVIVERQVAGDQLRLSVIGGRLVSAARLLPAQVQGNGRDTVAELVRRTRAERLLDEQLREFPFPIDDESLRLLAKVGLTLDSVPADGQTVLLRTNANLSGGGRIEIIDTVHPDNVLLAERAAATLGLDIAGIDLITTDIGRSWVETGAAICEVNPNPGFVRGQATPADLLDHLMAGVGDGRIPVVLVVGEPGQVGGAVELARQRLAGLGHRVVVAMDGRITLGGVAASGAPLTPGRAARMALADRLADAAVVALSEPDLIAGGLPFDRCNLAIWPAGEPTGAPGQALLGWLRASADELWLGDATTDWEAWAGACHA